MRINNTWVGYTTRSFSEIRTSIVKGLSTDVPEITDFSNSNSLMVLVNIFSGIAEMLNYYIDRMGEETFPVTARKFTSMTLHANSNGYQIKPAVASFGELVFEVVDAQGLPKLSTVQTILPKGTILYSIDNTPVTLTEDIIIQPGMYKMVKIPQGTYDTPLANFRQYTISSNIYIGDIGSNIFLPISYCHNTLELTIGGLPLKERDNELASENEVDTFYIAYQLGGGFLVKINTASPTGTPVYGRYATTSGSNGNIQSLQISDTSTFGGPDTIKYYNQKPFVGGADPEGIELIRARLGSKRRTNHRAVTRGDILDLTKLIPTINKAYLFGSCGNKINLFISPINGEIASNQLCGEVATELNAKMVYPREVLVNPAGVTHIYTKAKVFLKGGSSTTSATDAIKSVLSLKYSTTNSDINMPVYLSDIIAMIDNLTMVDHLNLEEIFAIPYINPVATMPVNKALTSITKIKPSYNQAVGIINWKLVYLSSTDTFTIYKDGIIYEIIQKVGTTWTLANTTLISLIITDNTYTNTDTWEFATHPTGSDILLQDNTFPLITPQDITLIYG